MDGRAVGRRFRAIREHLGRTQQEVSRASGVSQGDVSRLERGMAATIKVGTIDRIAVALGASLFLDVRYQGGLGDRLLDRAHAALVDHAVRSLVAEWEVVVEYAFNHFGDRGSVDILAWHPGTRTLLIIEVKSTFTDLQAMLVSIARKLRVVPDLVRQERGWDPVAVGRVVVVAGTTANRAIVAAHPAIFDVSFPARTRAVRSWLRAPSGPIAGIWFVSGDAVETSRHAGRRRRAERERRAGRAPS
jgi:transcriptional regulator with XRE-family HTH domain